MWPVFYCNAALMWFKAIIWPGKQPMMQMPWLLPYIHQSHPTHNRSSAVCARTLHYKQCCRSYLQCCFFADEVCCCDGDCCPVCIVLAGPQGLDQLRNGWDKSIHLHATTNYTCTRCSVDTPCAASLLCTNSGRLPVPTTCPCKCCISASCTPCMVDHL